jgi:hypothetical protein
MVWSKLRFFALMTVAAAACLAFSCAGSPSPKAASEPVTEEALPATEIEPVISPIPPLTAPQGDQPSFDPAKITAEVKTATFVDVRTLIDSLNLLVRRQDYTAWLSHLTDEYISFYSDPLILAKYSEYPIIKRKGIKLLTLKDYFINVVYPSHQNDKVDDIEFVSENLIKAITVSPKGDRNILYMLEKHGDAWKIGIGR